ncbi:DUF416 family protein [Tenggerimyces flavus]|uniref:DUF416 family protein n=1 Tax=Tenggerimyces flavus TaxID=1708749 RepID=A0ABV7Y691_9ACTN|nr:DUF416 family protein [Tenggerimyces flavus]MBM7788668.1 uncharacterized protein YjaG (DUF416 family) [Tenggerimyces flavus]
MTNEFGAHEAELALRLGRLDRRRRVAFSAACAERLWPLYVRFQSVTGEGDSEALAALIQRVWLAITRDDVDLSDLPAAVEALEPAEDHPRFVEAGYAENATACVFFALQSWLRDSVQDAVYAARQVYDVADFAAQQFESGSTFTPAMEERLRSSLFVVEAVRGINVDLAAVEVDDPDWDHLRDRARSEGRDWALAFPHGPEGVSDG